MPDGNSERQYHIGLAPGEVAQTILLCGDPARARMIAARFDDCAEEIAHREYVTITGTYGGQPVSVMATGIGCDNTEIAVVELCRLVEKPTLLRLGSCGGIAPETEIGDLCISTAALRLETTSLAFVDEGFPAVAHHECLLAAMTAADRLGKTTHVGITATAPGFYGAQGRMDDPVFPSRFPERLPHLRGQGVVNMEMESSTLFTLASLAGARAGTICVVYANREKGIFADEAQRPALQEDLIEVGLESLKVLAAMDSERNEQGEWIPPCLKSS